MPETPLQPLHGWGKFPIIPAHLNPLSRETISSFILDGRNIIPRGLGRSYGDAALSEEVILSNKLDHILGFDVQNGVLQCESGVSFDQILKHIVPHGWFLPVTPGTKFITVGGAIAHDIHGKNHHGEGSFSNFVEQLTLILADGTPLVCSKDVHADVFWATISGAGLTGFILEATFRLKKIESAYIRQTSIKAPNLDTIFGQFEENEAQYPYSVAWLDCLATSRNLGRSLLLLGHHAPSGELSSKQKRTPLLTHQDPKFRIPFDFPTFVLNRFSIKSFNTLFYHKQLSTTKTSILHYDPYFYPLDIMADWNKMYGKRGFVQYQCVFPLAASHEALTQLLKRVHQYGMASFLAVLKKFGKPDQGLLTFPMHGYTLTMDFPMNSSLPAFIAELDRLVLDFGGRVYLAKDALLSPASFRAMYPNFDTWRSIKTRLDPENKFHSHLAKRLEI